MKKKIHENLKAKEPMAFFDVYDHPFGIVVPGKTGIFWENQTEGVICNHVSIEGTWIPLAYPEAGTYDRIFHNCEELTAALQDANNNYDKERVRAIWKAITNVLRERDGLTFKIVDPPTGMPENQEGLYWIKILTWGEGLHQPRDLLLGKIVALYYPNCD